jgi:predicted enzyme involved in methoxymalonyl-ACP biosynthesis
MEDFVLNRLVEEVTQRGAELLVGEYVPTAKNKLVASHYRGLGFQEQAALWILDTGKFVPRPVKIQRSEPAVNASSSGIGCVTAGPKSVELVQKLK